MIAPEAIPAIIGLLFGAFWLWLCKYACKEKPPAPLVGCAKCGGLYAETFKKCPACSKELKA